MKFFFAGQFHTYAFQENPRKGQIENRLTSFFYIREGSTETENFKEHVSRRRAKDKKKRAIA